MARRGEGVERRAVPGLSVPPLSEWRFADALATFIAVPTELIDEQAAVARLLLVARSEGALRRAFELVTEHVRQRVQFGQALERFQVMRHKLADCFLAL